MIILGKTKRFLLGVLATACLAAPATANPSGPNVRHGQVNISPGVQTQIQQLTDQAIIDWNTFSIGSGESVQFLQPSDLSVILNRVTGVDPSVILGTLQANGNVFLINRNGILFGPESVVNVGGLVASTLNLSNEDFLAGNYAFAQVPGSELAAVVNQGKITISPGGYAVLTGPSVINEGTIVAHAGKVVLASGEQATLNLDGRDLVHFSLSGQVSEGPVLLAPGMLSETIAATLGVAPSRQATQIVRGEDGSVRLVNSSGTLVHSGEINVDASSGETAGSVLLDSSDLTLLTADSVISASGVGQNSDGGEILVLSDMEGDTSLGFTHVEAGALIAATGGETGDGGFIEVSGNRVNLHGDHDLSAPGGTGGSFLLDPIFITVIDGDNAPSVVGDVTTIGDQWLAGASGTSYTLTATRDILFDLGIAGSNPSGDGIIDFSPSGLTALTIEAGTDAVELGSINLGDDGTTFRGLDFLNLVADGDILWGNSTVQVAGNLVANAGGLLDLESSTIQVTSGGNIDLSAGTRLEGGTAVVNPGAGVNTTGYLQFISAGSIDLENANFTTDTDRVRPLVITAGTDLDFGSSVFDVFSQGTGGTKGLFVTAGGDIDLGTVDLTLRDDLNSSGSYRDLIMAGGRIFSSDTGGNAYKLTLNTENDLDIIAGDGILLPNLVLTADHVGSGVRDVSFQAGDGDLDLRDATISVEGEIEFLTNENLFFNRTRVDTTNQGDVLLSAGGDVVLENALINENPGVNSTGFLQIVGGGSVSLGSSTLKVDGDEFRPFAITAGTDLSLGSAVIDVFSQGTGGTGKGLVLTAGGDIDVGTVDLTLRDDLNSSGSYGDRIMAGGRIFSSDTGGNAYKLTLNTENDLDIIAGEGIFLPNLVLSTEHVNSGFRDVSFQAGDGDLDLRDATISVEGEIEFLTNENLFFNRTRVDTTNQGDILLNAGGDVVLENAFINENPGVNSTGFLQIVGGGSVSLGSSTLKVDGDEFRPFAITAGTDLSLGSAVIDVFSQGTGGFGKGLVLTAGGDIDVGTVDLTLRDDLNSSGSYGDLIMAGGRIFSSDTGSNSYSFNLNTQGDLDFIAGDGILLPNLVLSADHVNSGGVRDVSFQAGGGDLDLRDATISVEGEVEFLTNENLFFNRTRVDTTNQGDVLLNAGGDVTLENAFINENAGVGTTGFLSISGGGSVSLGSSTLRVDGDEVRPLAITAGTDLSLGSAVIDVFSQGTGGTKGLLLTAVGDIDLGTVDLTFRDRITNSGSYRDLISAGGTIFSSDTDGNSYVLDITSESGFDVVAGQGILLPNLSLAVRHVNAGGIKRDASFQAGDGDLDLRDADISVEGDVEFRTNENLFLNNTTVATTRLGDVLLDAGGDITLQAADINGSASSNTTGSLNINAGGAVSLGSSTLKVDAINEVRPFSITAGTDLDMGSALIDILADGSGGTKGLLLTAGGDLDLGTVDLTFRDNITSSGSFFNQITASGSILSTPGDGNFANRPGRLDIVGATLIQADIGDLDILDFEVVIDPLPGFSTADLTVRAPNGSTDFGESRFTVQNNLELISDGNLDLSSSEVIAGNRLVVASNGGVSAILGGGVSVPDIQIFGYNTTTSMPDSTIATNGGVTLGLVTAGNTDLSIFATGDIDVTHTGGGSITAERLGVEGSGNSTSRSAIWSTGGDVSLVSDGTINLGKGPGDQGAAIIRSDGVADVTIQADQLVNSVTLGTTIVDAQSAGFVNIVGPTSAEALEVSAPGISVSLADNPNSSSRVNIVGDSDFLKVAGNRSDIEVTELLTGNQLTMKQQTSDFVLTVDPLSVEGILYTDESDIALGDINTTADQTLAVRLGNTASISEAPTGFNLNIAGDLLLVAGGNIGTSSEPLTVPGGRTSIIAGGEVNIETPAADLTVAEVRQFDPFGNEVAFGEGFQSGADLTIRLTDDSGTVLTQEEDIRSSSGNVAIEILEGSLVQSPGAANPAPEISGGTVALSVSGDIGNYDGTTATPVRINADSLVVAGGADVILEQPVGDLEIINQATISGATYNTTGAVGDLRIQAGTGNLTVSTDLNVGGETALVTGADLDINPQFLPNSVFLNNSITSGQNLVILSNGDIVQNSGLLTAPAIGLGANGSIGSVGSPVNIQTDELALNPSTGQVFDADGFTEVQSVSAVGVTVNQGAPPPPPDPEPPIEPVVPPVVPNEPTGPFIVDGSDVIIPEFEVFESSFAQNNPDLVESYLDEVLTDLEYLELDPTGIPLGWYNDDDFLNKKFRR